MRLGRIEKWFMNRPQHARHAINRAEKLLKFINIKEGQNFLEVGCGNGAVSKYIAKKYLLNVTGVDLDKGMIKLAKQNIEDIPNIKIFETDATKLPFQDSNFDIVLSFGVMHHIPNWLDALMEIKRILKPKGYFVYGDIIYPKWSAKIGSFFKAKYGITTMNKIDSFIEENNFSEIYSSVSRLLIFDHIEAVYQRN